MYLQNLYKASIFLCFLISICHGEDTKNKTNKCDFTIEASGTKTFNCSRRGLEIVPQWTKELEEINDDEHVLLTFFSNNIKQITELPAVKGSRIAISFKSNRIQEIAVDAFQNIINMVYLDLSNNSLTGDVLRMEIFQGPYKNGTYESIALETLNLGFNKIHSMDKDIFQYTGNLTRLYMNNNPLEILDHVTLLALSSVPELQILDLAYTEIDTIPRDAFKALVNLQEIDLSGNRFTMVPECLALVGRTLEFLSFNNNPIVELNDDSFVGLSNLKVLEVAENIDLEEVKRSTFTPLTSLKTLHLCHNENLRYISHNAFRAMKNRWTLKEIYLDDNNLSELPEDLMPWDKLDVLGMTGNEWLCDCDLANIVIKQGAGTKFKPGEIPYCAAPSKMSGQYITNITMDNCPTDPTHSKKGSFFSGLKPKHILWSILGVALLVLVGMGLGFIINSIRLYFKNNVTNQSIRYINLQNSASSFA